MPWKTRILACDHIKQAASEFPRALLNYSTPIAVTPLLYYYYCIAVLCSLRLRLCSPRHHPLLFYFPKPVALMQPMHLFSKPARSEEKSLHTFVPLFQRQFSLVGLVFSVSRSQERSTTTWSRPKRRDGFSTAWPGRWRRERDARGRQE